MRNRDDKNPLNILMDKYAIAADRQMDTLKLKLIFVYFLHQNFLSKQNRLEKEKEKGNERKQKRKMQSHHDCKRSLKCIIKRLNCFLAWPIYLSNGYFFFGLLQIGSH